MALIHDDKLSDNPTIKVLVLSKEVDCLPQVINIEPITSTTHNDQTDRENSAYINQTEQESSALINNISGIAEPTPSTTHNNQTEEESSAHINKISGTVGPISYNPHNDHTEQENSAARRNNISRIAPGFNSDRHGILSDDDGDTDSQDKRHTSNMWESNDKHQSANMWESINMSSSNTVPLMLNNESDSEDNILNSVAMETCHDNIQSSVAMETCQDNIQSSVAMETCRVIKTEDTDIDHNGSCDRMSPLLNNTQDCTTLEHHFEKETSGIPLKPDLSFEFDRSNVKMESYSELDCMGKNTVKTSSASVGKIKKKRRRKTREHGTIFARRPIRKYHLKYMGKQNEIETEQQWSPSLPISPTPPTFPGVYRMLIFESLYTFYK